VAVAHDGGRDAVDEIADQWARERPGLPVDSIGVVARVLRLAKVFTDHRRRTLRSLGIDSATFDLLATLRRAGAPYRMTPAELSDACLVSGGGITQRVSRAEVAGLVDCHRTEGGRTVTVALTAAGHGVIERDIEAFLARERELIGHLAPDRRERLATLLRELLAGLPPS
jgi:DNA-binding MarR family transcriptional regulator